jgi:hypothetical protein
MSSLDANKGASFWNSSLPDATVPTCGAIQILSLRHSMTMFRISDTIRRTETPDGGILLDVHRGQMFCMNLVGAKILELMQRGYDESRIADEISRDYGANADVVRSDVIEFIETLYKHHILQPARPANVP